MAGTTVSATLEVEGLSALRMHLKRADVDMAAEMTGRLKELAGGVRDKAIQIAGQEGFNPPGRSGRGKGALVRSIKTSVRAGLATVRETANRDGFLYPAIYEYSSRYSRPFLEPALAAEEVTVLAGFEALLDGLLVGFDD